MIPNGNWAALRFLVHPPSENSISATSRPLFLVDDDEADRLILTRLMRATGLSNPCRMFPRGDALIDALIEVLRGAPAPLACFLDVKMPGMNGFDVLRWIRCQHALDDIPVVMLSSSEEQRDLHEAQHFGAQCYVAKFPPAETFRLIVDEAQRVAAAATITPFKLPCNLLLGTGAAVA